MRTRDLIPSRAASYSSQLTGHFARFPYEHRREKEKTSNPQITRLDIPQPTSSHCTAFAHHIENMRHPLIATSRHASRLRRRARKHYASLAALLFLGVLDDPNMLLVELKHLDEISTPEPTQYGSLEAYLLWTPLVNNVGCVLGLVAGLPVEVHNQLAGLFILASIDGLNLFLPAAARWLPRVGGTTGWGAAVCRTVSAALGACRRRATGAGTATLLARLGATRLFHDCVLATVGLVVLFQDLGSALTGKGC